MCWVCDELALERGDIIEIDSVENPIIKEHFRIESGTKGIILPNDEYFANIPEMLTGDRSHKVLVLENHEPISLYSLYQKYVVWRKIRHSSPQVVDVH